MAVDVPATGDPAAAPGPAPEVVDLLVVGAGPGGTAAAFRARELGLSVLSIDYDDVLKRIRDYSKDKLILPDFGGGDRMRFPKGGDLVSSLCFAPIDKDEMHLAWRGLYRRHGVAVRVGVELTGLARAGGLWQARAWDHGGRAEASLAARHVALAIGRGVPRRFDIPGNTDGIAFRLSDPGLFVGRPACVIGGGTSAAEAVVAISKAKAAAGDASAVYWSYRGDKMPRVSKALAEVFFEAYVGNGNIRYHPQSEPAAVVTGADRREYLAVRVDRRTLEARPAETTHLEFAKECCVACIGEDIPEAFLDSLGIRMAALPGKNRKLMVVSPLLETAQPNVYLVGDMLSHSYLETDDFAADPSTFREVRHRGNIKSALRDGVFVAEVVAQRLAGRTEIRVVVEDAPEPAGEARPAPALAAALRGEAQRPEPAQAHLATRAQEVRGSGAPASPEAAGRLVRLLPGGVEAEEFAVRAGAALTIGRQGADAAFPEDTALDDRHASLVVGPEGTSLRDDGSATGVFLRARPAEGMPLEPGVVIRAGRQFLLLVASAGGLELRHFDHQGSERGRHPAASRPAVFGRDSPDVVLDPTDLALSRRHFSLAAKEGRAVVKDLKSANGTWIKVRAAVLLADGDEFRVGRQVFRYGATGRPDRPSAPLAAAAARPVGSSAASPAQAAGASPGAVPGARPACVTSPASGDAGPPSVTIQGSGKTLPLRPGQTICELAEASGVAISAECHAGICGSDPIRVLSGREHLDEPGACEAETLTDLCGLEAGECRLACMVRPRGPVVIEIVRSGG